MADTGRISNRRRLALLILGFFWVSIGCGPSSLAFLVLPWVDDKLPAKFKVADPDKEVTLAVVAWNGNLEIRPEAATIDAELADRVAAKLRERFQYNKEKVKIVPNVQVRSHQNKQSVRGAWSPAEVGAQVKADYVIALEINSFTLYEKQSYNQLFRGNADISVKVYDLDEPEGQQTVFEEFYRTEYPKAQPVDAGNSSVLQFRSLFLDRVSRDISKLFSAYPYDQRMDMD